MPLRSISDDPLSARLLESLIGQPLVSNAFRGTLVEAMLSLEIEPIWRWCADGWGSFDFEGPSGIGLEVKQSAARQDWHDEASKPNPGRYDIAARTGRWEGNDWVKAPGRAAAIYVFAWHPIFDPKLADHRDASQWEFYVAATHLLPNQKSIGLSGVSSLSLPCKIGEVKGKITETLADLS
jgi:hypothetical protein